MVTVKKVSGKRMSKFEMSFRQRNIGKSNIVLHKKNNHNLAPN